MNQELKNIGSTTMTVKEIVDILNNEAKLAFERGDYDEIPNPLVHRDALRTLKVLESKQSFGLGAEITTPIISGKGREQNITTYQLNKRQSIALAARLSVDLHMAIIDRWQELENQQSKLPANYISALEALVVSEKKKEQLKLERDTAIKTKAEINNKKTATAMNTASQKSKEVNKLKIELDQSKQYCTIKRMEMVNHGQKFNWRLMKKAGLELGIAPIDVYDANYGTVKAYHKKCLVESLCINNRRWS